MLLDLQWVKDWADYCILGSGTRTEFQEEQVTMTENTRAA